MVFRNYKPSAGSGLLKEEEKEEEGLYHTYVGVEQFKEAAKLEEHYDKKAKLTIKKHLRSEEDPVAGLVPKRANIDLKRGLALKLDKLNSKTERAILELLSKRAALIDLIEEQMLKPGSR